MKDEDVPELLIAQSLFYEESILEHRFKEILNLVINPKSGKFWDVDTLRQAGKLSDTDIDYIKVEHNGHVPPYYHIGSIYRLMDDQKKEWLIADNYFKNKKYTD